MSWRRLVVACAVWAACSGGDKDGARDAAADSSPSETVADTAPAEVVETVENVALEDAALEDTGVVEEADVADTAVADTAPADIADSAEVSADRCHAISEWSDRAYEGADFTSASMSGMLDGQEVGRTQFIRLRASHEFSIHSYSEDVRGPTDASGWMWHAYCADGTDFYSEWQTTAEEDFSASGCTMVGGNPDGWTQAVYYRVRVRARIDGVSCDPQ